MWIGASVFVDAEEEMMTMQQRQRLVELGRAGLLSRGDAQMADLWTAEETRGIAVQGPVFEKEGAGRVAYWNFTIVGFDGQSKRTLEPPSASSPSPPCDRIPNVPNSKES